MNSSSTGEPAATACWEFCGADGRPVELRKAQPIVMDRYYRFEVEHLLGRSSFLPEHLYGGFLEGEYSDESTIMVWIARLRGA